jgi:hypothetical protein
MSSRTQTTRRRRHAKHARAGHKAKKARVAAGTPKFPIHPDQDKAGQAKAKTST